MELESTQVLDNERANDDNEDNTQVGVLSVGTTEHPIVKGFNKIGRSPALCKIVLNDATVSKVHAEIQAGCETAFLSDVRSANGTKIKDVPLKPFFYYTINNGDEIYLGAVKATFTMNKSPEHNALIVPETPVSSRRLDEKNTPGPRNTLDCLLNNTPQYQGDDSVIPGTQQKEKKTATFQEPLVPIDRRKSSNRSSISAIPASTSGKSKTNEKTTKSRDINDDTDLHDVETQQFDDSPLPCQSRASKKLQLDEVEQDIVEENIYDAETQILPLGTENKGATDVEKAEKGRINDTAASSSRCNNSSSNFSRELQISSSLSAPESPSPMDESADVIMSQNLLEMCETPILQHEKKIREKSLTDNATESNECEKAIKEDAVESEKETKTKVSPIAMDDSADRRKSVPSSTVIAESDDESATDDDMDTRIAKGGVPASSASDVIDDDSTTDDEGKFQSFASSSRSKEEQTSTSKIRRETAAGGDAADNIFEAATQQIDREAPKVADAKKCRETAKDRNAEVNIFEAATQRMDQNPPIVAGAKKRRETAKDRNAEVNIFEAATQRMDQVSPNASDAKEHQETAKDRDLAANIFDAETQRMDQEPPNNTPVNKRRETAKDRGTEMNIFEAATQRMDQQLSEVAGAKKRRDLTMEMHNDTDIDLLPTQVLDVPTSTPLSRSRKSNARSFEKCPRLETEEDIQFAPTQIMTDGDDIVGGNSREESSGASPSLGAENRGKRRDNCLANVDAVTPVPGTPSRKWMARKSDKSPRLRIEEDLRLAPMQIMIKGEDIVDGSTRKSSAAASSSAGPENTGEEKADRAVNLDETLMRNLGRILDEEANNREPEDESTQLLTQNLVDILKPTQNCDEENVDDIREPRSPKRKKISSPTTLGFVDGRAVAGATWNKTVPTATSTMRDDGDKDEEKADVAIGEPPLSASGHLLPECLDEDDILFGLPEVKISGTLSNPGSPCPSTTSSHSDFVVPGLRETGNFVKIEKTAAVESTESSSSLKAIEATKSLEPDSPVVPKRSRAARRKVPRKLIEDEDEDKDEDEVLGYSDLKKIADRLLASVSVESTKSTKSDNDGAAVERESLSTTGRRGRRAGKAIPPRKNANPSEGTQKLAQPPSSLIVTDAKSKRSVHESTSTDTESSSAGTSRNSSRLAKSTKAKAARSKVEPKRGKESQEVEAILAATPRENIPVVSRQPYVKVHLTRLDNIDVEQMNNEADNLLTPRVNRKRRATVSAKDLTPSTASPANAKSRRTIGEGLDARALPKEEHKVLITGLTEDYSKIVKKLGGSVVSEPSKATVLITDKVRRTYKFLCAVARGLRVVSIKWLIESSKAARFLDCDDFILNDPAAERQYRFKLEKSLQTARTKKLLEGYTIVVTPKVNQPEIHELRGMIEACGGKVLTRAPGARAWNSKTVIVSREEDLTAINVLLSKCPKSLKITVQSTEFILAGILRQEVNLIEHRLDIS